MFVHMHMSVHMYLCVGCRGCRYGLDRPTLVCIIAISLALLCIILIIFRRNYPNWIFTRVEHFPFPYTLHAYLYIFTKLMYILINISESRPICPFKLKLVCCTSLKLNILLIFVKIFLIKFVFKKTSHKIYKNNIYK